jgi:hypothetical protein
MDTTFTLPAAQPEHILIMRAHGGYNGNYHKAIERQGARVVHHDRIPKTVEMTVEGVVAWINSRRGV